MTILLRNVCIYLLLLNSGSLSAQITLLSSFDPGEGSLCGIAQDADSGDLWIYPCFDADLHHYSQSGDFLGTVPRPGETANDVDLEFTPVEIVLNQTTIPVNTLLFINGESGPAEIYAVDTATGVVLDTLQTLFGVSHVVGGAVHPDRETLFLVQDDVPGAADENRIAEVDPVSGDTLNVFFIGDRFNVSFGDLDVDSNDGNLFVVSSDSSNIAVFAPTGAFITSHALPPGAGSLSGLALDCDSEEAWASGSGGDVFHLGGIPCGMSTSVEEQGLPLIIRLSTGHPNPFNPSTTFTLDVAVPIEVMVDVVDVLGRRVAFLLNGPLAGGTYTLRFDAGDLPSGVYLIRASAEGFRETRSVTLLK